MAPVLDTMIPKHHNTSDHSNMLTFPKSFPFLFLLGMPLTDCLQLTKCGYSIVALLTDACVKM